MLESAGLEPVPATLQAWAGRHSPVKQDCDTRYEEIQVGCNCTPLYDNYTEAYLRDEPILILFRRRKDEDDDNHERKKDASVEKSCKERKRSREKAWKSLKKRTREKRYK